MAKLREKIEALEKEKKETYERLLRAAADLDNFRKRTRKEMDDARILAKEQVLKELLPGIDNLERALAVAGGEGGAEAIVEGVRLVLRQFQTGLDRAEVKSFESVGQPFDPTRHEAISQIETTEHPPGTVASEMQRGYTIGNRLLRPALVAVAKAPTPKDDIP
jgi:molecular chaperone GrpE